MGGVEYLMSEKIVGFVEFRTVAAGASVGN
jgi:hypothetical protein